MDEENIIHNHYVELANGHSLSFFFNETTGLLVVDVIHRDGTGGNEIVRKTVDVPVLMKDMKKAIRRWGKVGSVDARD